MFAALNLIPDSWQSGPLNEVIIIGAVVGAVAVVSRMIVVPIVRWLIRLAVGIETGVERLSNVVEHEHRLDSIETAITDIREALRPTNGDRRSISDRLDTVKQQTNQNADEIKALRGDLSARNNKEFSE